jgi:hypothetical protein
VRPECSPITVMSFRAPTRSLENVEELVDWQRPKEQSLI